MTLFFKSKAKAFLRDAFSLVEVTLAVAIAALAITTLMALMPHSISTVRAAATATLQARIIAQVIGEIQLSDWGTHDGGSPGKWSNLQLLIAKKWLFDDQGSMLDPADSTTIETRLASVVQVRVSPSTLIFPGGTTQSSDAQGVMVDVAATADSKFPFVVKGTFHTVPAILTRQFSN